MKHIINSAIILMSLMAVSCIKHPDYVSEPSQNRQYVLTLANDSPFNTVWYIPEHGDKGCERAGELPDKKPAESSLISLDPKTSFDVYVTNDGIESALETYHPQDEVVIYIFDPEVLSMEEWDSVKAGEKWLDKFSLTVEEVVESNKIVKFKK
ncbi:MAG: hypothetical protein MSA02_02560 [Bacteroidales bacterium]|nr:hypothetical protein [Bacteroidales bacterium]MDD5911481.1 hypothetical protein [Bacteroidales bacterium]